MRRGAVDQTAAPPRADDIAGPVDPKVIHKGLEFPSADLSNGVFLPAWSVREQQLPEELALPGTHYRLAFSTLGAIMSSWSSGAPYYRGRACEGRPSAPLPWRQLPMAWASQGPRHSCLTPSDRRFHHPEVGSIWACSWTS